jgi:hypothetical protein
MIVGDCGYFDSEGNFLAKFPLKINVFVTSGTCFYALETDEEGNQIITRYRYQIKLR